MSYNYNPTTGNFETTSGQGQTRTYPKSSSYHPAPARPRTTSRSSHDFSGILGFIAYIVLRVAIYGGILGLVSLCS